MSFDKPTEKHSVDSIYLFYPAKTVKGKWSCFDTVYIEDDFSNKKVNYYTKKDIAARKLKGAEIEINDKSKKSHIKNGLIRLANPAICIGVILFVGVTVAKLIII